MSATRTRLLQATLASVAELGFAATTTETIVGRAQLGIGTLFRQFASKQALLAQAFTYADTLLFRPGQDLPGDSLYAQLQALWHRTARQALAHPSAFTYWRLFRATPQDANWGFPGELRLGAFGGVPLALQRATHAPLDRYSEFDAWLLVSQWTAAVHFALAPAQPRRVGWGLVEPVPAPEHLLATAFEAYWASLRLARHTPAELSFYG